MTSSFFASPRWRIWGWVLLPLFLLVLAALRPLALPDEGRYAEVGRWMAMSGDWLTPRLDGIPFFHKPPLLYWLEAAVMSVLGATPWAARLVVAVHGCLMLGLMWVCTRHIAGAKVAQRAAWMFGSSLAFLVGGQYVNHDMMVATWMGVAIWCFARAFMHDAGVHAGWARWGFVACALGVLSKGLIGLLLPGLVLFVWIAYTWQWRKILALPWVSGLFLFAIIALPWFVLAAREHPDMLAYMFGKHQFGRYTATTFNNGRPWWFYGLAITVLMFPWVFVVAADGVQRLRTAAIRMLRSGAHDVGAGDVDARWVALCWIWIVAILGFFSIPNSKLIGYALPVMPALAVLAALWWQQHVAPRHWGRFVFGALVVVNLGLAIVAQVSASRYTEQRGTRDVAEVLACAAQSTDVVAAVDDYPYDLPFYAQLTRPLEVIQDWGTLRQTAGDNWRRELFEGADFDASAARSLVPMARLQALKQEPHAWVVAPNASAVLNAQAHEGFTLITTGQAWSLYRSSLAFERPESTEQKSLRGCKHQRKK
jgi:4-amino-4-deoxy-L-arabinose transferase-like glycosyltransferase